MTRDKRSALFGDLDQFTPKATPAPRPDAEAVTAAAEGAGYINRDPVAAPSASEDAEAKQPRRRRRRSGRTDQLSVRLRPEEIDQFYDLCDRQGWTLGEGFEKALALAVKKYR